MKIKLFIVFLISSIFSYGQCFDCGQSIGGFVEDYIADIDQVTDGIILTINPDQGWGRSILKYDFNCNLIWSNEFEPDSGVADFMIFFDTTTDENNNIYSTISNSRDGVIVQGFSIERGNSLIKLDPNGVILWVQKISDEYYLHRKVHYYMNTIYVAGQLDVGIDTNIGLTIENLGSQYFLAKFDLSGNLINAEQYGNSSDETFFDSQIDESGNIYLTGTISSSSNHISHLYKIDSNLDLVWSQELSNNPGDRAFRPMSIYYNNTNEKLYVWSKYYITANFYNNSIAVSNSCDVGSVIMEISRNTGELENYKVIDNCGFYDPVGNGIGDVLQKSFMTHQDSDLYILSSLRGELTLGNQTVSTSQTIFGSYNSDLILHKIDLNNFSSELILQSTGEQYYDSSTYHDLAGPILSIDENIYLTSSFMSYPITINGNTIANNSGNNSRDILFYKHNLNQGITENLISFENTCFSDTTMFEISGDFDSVLWNFDDPASGVNNTSTLNNPNHAFSDIGNYNVSVLVTCGSETETVNIEVVITESPSINEVTDLYACEDSYNSQVSSNFDTTLIENEIIGNQQDLIIQYFDYNGTELPSPLPNPMTNTVPGQETITVRVSYNDNSTCYSETSFDLIVNPQPVINEVSNIFACDDDNDGIANFDISNLETNILGGQTGMVIELFYENGQQIPNPLPNTIQNSVPDQETISFRITNPNSNCYNEGSFNLIVNPLPQANPMEIIYGCDDNNDGISEYFDTSNIENLVLNGQTGVSIRYFNENGIELPSPLPNPYTNAVLFDEQITIRVTDDNSLCYSETILDLQTVTQPIINQPQDLYACDQGNGFAQFDTSTIEEQLIGNQTGLTIEYFDSNNNALPSPLPQFIENSEPYSQTVFVRVEDNINSNCYSETSFNLIVNPLLEIQLDSEYFICNLDPSLSLSVDAGFNSYQWLFEDGTLISELNTAQISDEGNYMLTVSQSSNGVLCESTFSFDLIRSSLPVIQNINFGELGNNFIEIDASGDGEFEYSIDGVNYQQSNYFSNVEGGVYRVYVRDREGCGQDSEEITIIDYPKFFTPNNDGYNDFWQIKGISNFPQSEISIYNRFGKLIRKLSSEDIGWDGLYNGKVMGSNDYWFKADLGNGVSFSGHFALRR